MSHYNNIAGLVSKILNARHGEMVNYIETLIDSGDWRDFTRVSRCAVMPPGNAGRSNGVKKGQPWEAIARKLLAVAETCPSS